MSKYQINYSRVAPDHRVPWDYTFVKKTQTPLDYMKVRQFVNNFIAMETRFQYFMAQILSDTHRRALDCVAWWSQSCHVVE
jgi:hypothetical protein